MMIINSLDMDGEINARQTLDGRLKADALLKGEVKTGMSTGGGIGVEFGATEYFDTSEEVPKAGTILVYTDHITIDDKPYPAIKIADGENLPKDLLFVTEGEFLSVYPQLEQLSEQFSSLAEVSHTGSYNDLTDKPTIPVVPSEVSAFNNDAGYITEDAVADKMERIVLYLSNNSGAYNLRMADNTSVDFATLYGFCRDESKYVVVLMGNSKLRPQYVSVNEIHCDGEDRDSQGTMFLRMVMTSRSLYYTTDRLADKADVTNLSNSLSDVATSGNYDDLEGKPTIPTVPTDVSAFTNDAGYLTEHQSLAEYAKKSELPTVPSVVSAFINDAGYLTEHQSLSGYATESFVAEEFARQLAAIDGNEVAY